MPALGADMDAGTLLEWLVKPGDEVHKGDVIAVVDTDKAAIDVESFASGFVERLIVGPGERVPVGTVLAIIGDKAAAAGITAPAAGEGGQPGQPQADTCSPLVRHLAEKLGVDLETVRGTGHGGTITRDDVTRAAAPRHDRPVIAEPEAGPSVRRRVTPVARRLAAELGVDVAAIAGSGTGGAVREADVRQAAERAAAGGGRAEEVPRGQPSAAGATAGPVAPAAEAGAPALARAQAMRQVTARLMARSKREIPHYYLSQTIDLTAAMSWLHDRNRELDVDDRLVPSALLLRATALAARRVPALNGYWTDGRFVAGEGVHLGVAIAVRGGGLVTPAIHDAADLPPVALMGRLRDLVARARTGRLRGSELTDATITVTNLGDQGAESVYGVIYPPQVALVGFGKVIERPVAVNGLVGARPVVIATLAADHRATDGYTGGRFLGVLADLLQRPEEL